MSFLTALAGLSWRSFCLAKASLNEIASFAAMCSIFSMDFFPIPRFGSFKIIFIALSSSGFAAA